MNDPADLELSLRRQDAVRYTVDLVFSQPGSEADVRPLDQQAVSVTFDTLRLGEFALDPVGYGQALGKMLFADSALATAFAECRATAQSHKMPLRLRLSIAPDAPELHAIRWETLRDPQTKQPLALSEQIILTRALGSADWQPVTLRAKGDLRALVVIAAPAGLDRFNLAHIDTEAEQLLTLAGLREIDKTVLSKPGQASLPTLIIHLRDGYDILYLVAHGVVVDGEPWLFLDDGQGRVARISGTDLVARIANLPIRPRLVLLSSCQSAGDGSRNALVSLGPRLATAGIPAVIAMQGQLSIATNAVFAPAFFRELRRDGRIDRALAAARQTIANRPDWWMPVLWLRISNGRLWTADIESQRRFLEQWIHRTLIAHDIAYIGDVHQIAALVTACASWDRVMTPDLPHDLNRLLDVLHPLGIGSTSQPWHDLCHYVDQALPQGKITRRLMYALIRDAQALRLRDLDISWLYDKHRPPGALWEKRRQDVTSLTQLIRILARADPVEKHHALVDIAWRLADSGEHEQRLLGTVQALRDWARTMASALGVDLPTDNLPPTPTHRDQHLQMRLAPVPTGATSRPSYYLDAWLRTGDRWASVRHHQEVDSNTIQDALDALLRDLGSRFRRTPDSIIELFIPHGLLLLDVDRWLLGGSIRAPLGLNYHVIVRSFERSDTSGWKMWDMWRHKWRLRTQFQGFGGLIWVTGPDAIPSLLNFYGHLQGDACMGVVQTWIPDYRANHALRFEKIVDHVVAAGIVTALFVRPCDHAPADARACLEPLLLTHTIQEVVRIQRRTAADDDVHLGAHLTLMWDPPELLPPDVQDIFEESEVAR